MGHTCTFRISSWAQIIPLLRPCAVADGTVLVSRGLSRRYGGHRRCAQPGWTGAVGSSARRFARGDGRLEGGRPGFRLGSGSGPGPARRTCRRAACWHRTAGRAGGVLCQPPARLPPAPGLAECRLRACTSVGNDYRSGRLFVHGGVADGGAAGTGVDGGPGDDVVVGIVEGDGAGDRAIAAAGGSAFVFDLPVVDVDNVTAGACGQAAQSTWEPGVILNTPMARLTR